MKSIRLFLIATLLAVITLANFLAAVQGYRASTERAQELLDIQLADTAALLSTTPISNRQIVQQPSGRLAFQIWSDGGKLLKRSSNTPATAIAELVPGYREDNFSNFRWRILSHHDAANKRWILVAERVDVRIDLADSIVIESVLPVLMGLPIVALLVWFIVGNGLSLLNTLAAEVAARRSDDLSALEITDPPVELAPVVTAINSLLQRLSAAVQREQRFASDAAHEMRTPLSALKVHIHNLKQDLPEHSDKLSSLDYDVARLEHLIEQIMLLHRISPENYHANMQTVSLQEIVQAVVSDVTPEINSRNQTITIKGEDQHIQGDAASLGILVSNLTLNASHYSPEGATLAIDIGANDFGVYLDVIDNGPGIPYVELRRVLDRFYRGGGDRHHSDFEGCGLGLAIAQHIAELHEAELMLNNNSPAAGLTARVLFPRHRFRAVQPELVS